jgi:hypothetical protein
MFALTFALLHFLCLARNPDGGAPAAAGPTKRLAELEIFTFFAEKQRMGHCMFFQLLAAAHGLQRSLVSGRSTAT